MLIDTHAHLDQDDFDADREAVIERARQAGVEAIVTIGITAQSSQACVELAARHADIWAAVGIQPNHTAETATGDWDAIVALSQASRVVALGETGLDRYWDRSPFATQQDYFDRHLQLAQQIGRPVVIHTRDCDADVLVMLRAARQRGKVTGVMHSFTGAAETAAECVELGLYVSFAGMVTFKKSVELRAVAASIPAERILIETDSPYLSPQPLRGRRNEPAHLVHTAACLAEVRGQSAEDFAAQTTANARALFGLESWGA